MPRYKEETSNNNLLIWAIRVVSTSLVYPSDPHYLQHLKPETTHSEEKVFRGWEGLEHRLYYTVVSHSDIMSRRPISIHV